jgi:hypothetical protein
MFLREVHLVHKDVNVPLYSVNKPGNQMSVSGICKQIKYCVTDQGSEPPGPSTGYPSVGPKWHITLMYPRLISKKYIGHERETNNLSSCWD